MMTSNRGTALSSSCTTRTSTGWLLAPTVCRRSPRPSWNTFADALIRRTARDCQFCTSYEWARLRTGMAKKEGDLAATDERAAAGHAVERVGEAVAERHDRAAEDGEQRTRDRRHPWVWEGREPTKDLLVDGTRRVRVIETEVPPEQIDDREGGRRRADRQPGHAPERAAHAGAHRIDARRTGPILADRMEAACRTSFACLVRRRRAALRYRRFLCRRWKRPMRRPR